MKTATISETKNQLSALLEHVKRGETVVILDRDRPIAQLVPYQSPSSDVPEWVIELERCGLIRPPRDPDSKFVPNPLKPKKKGVSAVAAVLAEREEGR